MTSHQSNPNRYNSTTYVAPYVDLAPPAWSPAPTNTELVPVAHDLALRTGQHSAQIRTTDDALSHARADLLVSVGYVAAAAMAIAGLLLLAALAGVVGWGIGQHVAAWIGGVGIVALVVIYATRRQSHHYSAGGIAHAEIQSRERIAMQALRLHAAILLRREVRR